MWVFLGILSAFFLGLYDVFRKVSLSRNAVLPVLFLACLSGAIIFVPFFLLSTLNPSFQGTIWFVPKVSAFVHLLILLKSCLVLSSWIFAYYSFKHLPVTIASPISTSGPMWTIIGAMVIFGERLSVIQWSGVIVCIVSYYIFSLEGRKEGIHFTKNKWVLFITIATILGSVSSLYDKYLIQNFDRMAVQVFFSFYMVLILIPVLLIFWYPSRKKHDLFQWRFAIPMIGIVLSIADFIYFYSLSIPGSMISILSTLRRSGVIVSFLIGSSLFREENIRMKFYILLGILTGIILLIIGTGK
jgi:bacterial/archaeal transporter family protein